MPPRELIEPGMVVAGRYRVTRKLGQGGMGVVFAATDTALKRQVAIKHLAPAVAANEANVIRFKREARAAAALKSEHVVRIHDVDELPGRVPYMVMELLEGRDLSAVVQERGRIGPGLAVEWVLQAAEAIAEAHNAGIVHRDLKPQNLFLTKRADGSDLVKVLDFGLAKVVAAGEPRLTATAATMGSPQYMSPEQAHGARDVDARTDVWALGVTLYELVTGAMPFGGRSPMEAMMKILEEEPRPPREVAPNVPVGLAGAILRALEKDRDRRFRDVAELAEAIVPFAPPGSKAAKNDVRRILEATHRDPEPPAAPDPAVAKTLLRPRPKRKKQGPPLLAIAAIGGLVLGLVVFAVLVALHERLH